MTVVAIRSLLPGHRISSTYCRVVDKLHEAVINETSQTVLYAGRYNPKGEFAVLYLAARPECGYREVMQRVGNKEHLLKPRIVGTFEVQLTRCLDLINEESRRVLEVTLEDLTTLGQYKITQAIAREARAIGFEAVLAPSAVGKDCHNLVVFNDRLDSGSSCRLVPKSVRSYP